MMGLDTSHDCWHGSYSAFSMWREFIAEAAGYDVAMVTWPGGSPRTAVLIDWGHITEDNLLGRWRKTPDDPLLVLVAHSDCDGEIRPEQAVPLADRLVDLLPAIGRATSRGNAIDLHAVAWTTRFINGLRAAAAANEPVLFR